MHLDHSLEVGSFRDRQALVTRGSEYGIIDEVVRSFAVRILRHAMSVCYGTILRVTYSVRHDRVYAEKEYQGSDDEVSIL